MKTATLKDISTNTLAGSAPHDRFPLARVLILILAGAFVGLMGDIRAEHVDAVRDHPIAWLPIIYSAFMTLACLAAFVFWNKIARLIMAACEQEIGA